MLTRKNACVRARSGGGVCSGAVAAAVPTTTELRFETIGRSMWPLLRPGDVVCAEPLRDPGRVIVPGDIVVFVSTGGTLVAHRVVAVLTDGRIQVRGDFAFSPDPPIEARRIVGRITSVARGSRDVALDGPVGRLLAYGIPRLERGAPWVLRLLRRTVIASVVLGDRVWTADALRRIRRARGLGGRLVIARSGSLDASALTAHLRRTGQDPSKWEAPLESKILVIARRAGGQIVARCLVVRRSVLGEPAAQPWHVADVHVEHRWRGSGIGRRLLLAALVEVAAREPSAEVGAWVSGGDRRARRLFQSAGFSWRQDGPDSRALFVLGRPDGR
jgi:GNAT superfamily N-acetyltransferase